MEPVVTARGGSAGGAGKTLLHGLVALSNINSSNRSRSGGCRPGPFGAGPRADPSLRHRPPPPRPAELRERNAGRLSAVDRAGWCHFLRDSPKSRMRQARCLIPVFRMRKTMLRAPRPGPRRDFVVFQGTGPGPRARSAKAGSVLSRPCRSFDAKRLFRGDFGDRLLRGGAELKVRSQRWNWDSDQQRGSGAPQGAAITGL